MLLEPRGDSECRHRPRPAREDAPGWLNGVHPTLEEGVVARQVCFHWSNNTCNWNSDIEVVNCGDYYLYNLVQPSTCDLRYCGADTP